MRQCASLSVNKPAIEQAELSDWIRPVAELAGDGRGTDRRDCEWVWSDVLRGSHAQSSDGSVSSKSAGSEWYEDPATATPKWLEMRSYMKKRPRSR
jgi:hypothetical protein